MKNFTATFVAILVLSVMSLNAQENTSETMKQFLKDIPALSTEKITSISDLVEASKKKATKAIDLTKENIAESLKEAQGKTCIIVVENHTFVKFSDVKKCNQSGSWGACMPYGEGYIQKGGLKSSNDYINNIIGKPDTQKRVLFLF